MFAKKGRFRFVKLKMKIIGFLLVFFPVFYGLNIYVSKFGVDNDTCGAIESPCGTLYYSSIIYNNVIDSEYMLNIINGQNESQILEYITNNNTDGWHPCLPQKLMYNESGLIYYNFDSSNIKSMNDWFPEICRSITYYNNKYMFEIDIERSNQTSQSSTLFHVSFTNLIIQDFNANITDGIIYSYAYELALNDCFFTDFNIYNDDSSKYVLYIFPILVINVFYNHRYSRYKSSNDYWGQYYAK